MKRIIFLLIVLVLFAVSCGKSKIVVEHNGSDEAGDIDETTQADEDSDEDADDDDAPEIDDAGLPDADAPDYSGTYGLPKCSLQGKTPCFDPMTDLVWSSLSDPLEHDEALIHCYNLDEGGFKDWYLPDIDELRTLVRHCPDLEPEGECKVSEKGGCLDYSGECFNDPCFITQCAAKEDEIFSRLWDTDELWSSSRCLGEGNKRFWTVRFNIPRVDYAYVYQGVAKPVRCTRSIHSSGKDDTLEPRTVECSGLPGNAQWNTVSSITQTWNGAKWEPDTHAIYDEKPSTENCRYKCMDTAFHHVWTVYGEEHEKCVQICGKADTDLCMYPDSDRFYDKKSGLMWSSLADDSIYQDSSIKPHQNAVSYCENLTEGGFSDWYLPSIEELRTLIQNCPATETDGTCELELTQYGAVPGECSSCDYDGEYSGKYSILADVLTSLWSSSEAESYSEGSTVKYYWYAKFETGALQIASERSYLDVRCARKGQ